MKSIAKAAHHHLRALKPNNKVGYQRIRMAPKLTQPSLIGQTRQFSTGQVSVSPARNENHQVRADIHRGKNRKPYSYKVGD
jgi:hypothetical protein